MLGRFLSAFRELPLLYRIVSGVVGVGLVLGLVLQWNPMVGLAALGILVGVVLLLLLIQFILKRWEKRRNSELAGALEGGGGDLNTIADEERRQAVSEVRDQWNRAVTELKGTGMNLYSLPWYMLIGEPACGKSTTLKNSGMEFPVGTEGLSGAGGTRNCDWWFTNEAVILDTAGRFTFEERNAPDASEWQEFLGLLKKYRPRCPINGVIVAIPATSLLGDPATEIERKAKIIREKLTQLEQELEVQFPVYLVVTKCDLLLGFAEFFQRLPALEQRQLFGWSKPQPYDELFPQDQWPGVFQGIRQRLHLWRNRFLADDPDAGDVDRLYAFPDEFDALEDPLKRYLGEIFVANRYLDPLFFRGIYFSSGLQKGKPIVKACANLLRAASGGPDEMDLSSLFQKSTAFFVRDFYRKKLFKEQGLLQPTRLAMKKRRVVERVGYGVAGGLGLILLILLVYGGFVQGSGASTMDTKLKAMQEATAEWSNDGSEDLATLPLTEGKELHKEIVSAVENHSLDPFLLGFGTDDDLVNLGKSYTQLTSAAIFKILGVKALAGLKAGRPTSWYEQEEYHQSLLVYCTLLKQADSEAKVPASDAAGSSMRRQVPWTLRPLLALLERRGQLKEGEGEVFEAQYQSLLDVCRDTGVGRPCLREAFLPSKTNPEAQEVVAELFNNYADYWQATADGADTIVGLVDGRVEVLGQPMGVDDANGGTTSSSEESSGQLPAELLDAAIWLRAQEIDLSCEVADRDSGKVQLTGHTRFRDAEEELARWEGYLSHVGSVDTSLERMKEEDESFFHRMEEAVALVDFTANRGLADRTVIGKLAAVCEEKLTELEQLKEGAADPEVAEFFVEPVQKSRTKLKEDLDEASTEVRKRFFDDDRTQYILSWTRKGNGPFNLKIDEKSAFEMKAMQMCHEAVVAALREDELVEPAALDLVLRQRLDALAQAAKSVETLQDESGKGVGTLLLEQLTQVTELAKRVLVARALVAYPGVVEDRKPEVLSAFADPMKDQLPPLQVNWEVAPAHRREVAERVILHADYLVSLTLGDLAQLMSTDEKEALEGEVGKLLDEYLRAYQAEWDQKWIGVFDPNLDFGDLDWANYKKSLNDGFGLLTPGKGAGAAQDALSRAIQTLKDHLDFDDLDYQTFKDGFPLAELPYLDASFGKFRRHFLPFLEAFQSEAAGGDPAETENVSIQLVRTFGDFIEAVRGLQASKLRSDLSDPVDAEKGTTVRDRIAACEVLFTTYPNLKADRVARRVLDAVVAGRERIEEQLRAQFIQRWRAVGDQFSGDKLNARAPFVERETEDPPAEVGRKTFVSLYDETKRIDDDWDLFYREEKDTHVCLRLDERETKTAREDITGFIDSMLGLGKHMDLADKNEVEFELTANYKPDRDEDELGTFPGVGALTGSFATEKSHVIEFQVKTEKDDKKLKPKGKIGRSKSFTWSYADAKAKLRLVMIARGGQPLDDRPWPIAELQDGWFALARVLWRSGLPADEKRETWLMVHELPDRAGGESTIALHVVKLKEGQGLPERPQYEWTGWK